MEAANRIIHYKDSLIHVYITGHGAKWLFCFHGYGEDGSSFEMLGDLLGGEYTLAAIDLPFHGKTVWKEGLLMTPDDLVTILRTILRENGHETSRYSLLAFSLGGRVALHLLEMIPGNIERVVLLAPDGLQLNFWYWLGTQTYIGNKLFLYTMRSPEWFFTVANAGHRIGLVNNSIIRFIHQFLDDHATRIQLYRRWTTLRKFRPKAAAVDKVLDKYPIPVRILFGKYDRIILSKRSKFFRGNTHVSVSVIDAGHQLLKKRFAPDIALLFSK